MLSCCFSFFNFVLARLCVRCVCAYDPHSLRKRRRYLRRAYRGVHAEGGQHTQGTVRVGIDYRLELALMLGVHDIMSYRPPRSVTVCLCVLLVGGSLFLCV